MTKYLLSFVLLATSLFGQFTYNAGITTDYIFRGVSQTENKGALSFGVDYERGVLYSGVWTSNVSFDDKTNREVDVWIGAQKTFKDTTVDFSIPYYAYFNGDDKINMVETKLVVSQKVGRFNLANTAAYSPDYLNSYGKSVWLESVLSFEVAKNLTASGGYGRQSVKKADTYSTWHVGLTYILNNAEIDVRYSETNRRDLGDLYDPAVVASLKLTF